MYSVTIRVRRKWILTVFITAFAIIAGATIGSFLLSDSQPVTAVPVKKVGYANLPDNKSRVEFLQSLGWQVEDEPSEIVQVLVPQEFDNVYKKYNELQKEQGFDLEKYKGRTVKRYTYRIKNVPEGENVVADLFIFGDKLVAGDINNVAIDGYMIALNGKLPR